MQRHLSRLETAGLSLAILLLLGHALLTLRRGLWMEGLIDVAMAAGLIAFYWLVARLLHGTHEPGVVAQAVVPRPERISACRVDVHGKGWALWHLHTGLCLPLEEGDLFSIVDPSIVPGPIDGTSFGEQR
jgi:hypothetical protein